MALLLVASSLTAQPEICKNDWDKAVKLRNEHKYKEAASAFRKAAECPGFVATDKVQLYDLAKKCESLVKGSGKDKTQTQKPNPTAKPSKPTGRPEVEILYSGYIRAACNGGVRGAEMEVLMSAKNLKNKNLIIRCMISPKDGSGLVNVTSPLAAEYTLEGGLAGQEQEVSFVEEEEWVNVKIFVPFSVMDFSGDYSAQMIKSDLYVFQKGDKSPIAENHCVYDALSPHTIALGGRVGDYILETDWLGGLLDLHPAVCAGNEVLWRDLPSWIVMDDAGVHVTENPSPDSRTATLHVSSSEGGNVVNVIINQKGREEGQGAIARINSVRLEENYVHPRVGVRQVRIHVECEVSGARGKEIRAYAILYCSDGVTPMHTSTGDEMKYFGRGIADYTESAFDDIPVCVSYRSLYDASNCGDNKAVYYICISEDQGESWLAKSGPYTLTW